MREPVTITLAGASYNIRPLTLGQVRDIDHALASSPAKPGSAVDLCIAVLRIGLARDFPEVAEKVEEIECTTAEASAAMGGILQAGGFQDGVKPEEAEADPDLSTGSASAAA